MRSSAAALLEVASMLHPLRVLAFLLCASCASSPVHERCRFVVEHVPPPRMPDGFRELDSMFLRRAWDMTAVARGLSGRWSERYRHTFAEQLLPAICERVERARAEAAGGEARKAGAHYQGLLVASQVLALHLAYVETADAADQAGQPSPAIYSVLQGVEEEMRPYWTAALLDNTSDLVRSMPELTSRYNARLTYLDTWIGQMKLGQRRVAIARVLWDTFMATVASYELAGAMAGAAASRGLPPTIASIAGGGGASIAGSVDAAALEALRKLIAAGALDATVVTAISRMTGGTGGGNELVLKRPTPMAMEQAHGSGGTSPGRPQASGKIAKQIRISKKEYGEVARHWEDAQKAGKPRYLTIDRPGTDPRRAAALSGTSRQPPLDRDEYPPAMFREGGANASVKLLDKYLNRALGGYIRGQCEGLPDGAVVELVITD